MDRLININSKVMDFDDKEMLLERIRIKNLISPTQVENYKCSKCKDRNYILVEEGAKLCDCTKSRKNEAIFSKSGINRNFRNMTFENFDYSRSESIANAFKISLLYNNNFEEIETKRCNSITYLGSSGVGKTHLSMAISNKLINKGVVVIYMPFREEITLIKQNILDANKYNKIIKKYKTCRMLVIDDLFKGNISKSDINIMFEIINYRYFNNLPMIISSELSLEELLLVDEALGSRILEMSKEYLIQILEKNLNYRIYN